MSHATRLNDPNTEGRVLLAIQAFHRGQFKSLRSAALSYDAPYRTVLYRYKGRKACQDCLPNSQKLTPTEESALEQWILSMDERGIPLRINMVRDMAQLLLAERTAAGSNTIGANWVSKFVNRHDTLKSKYGRKYDYNRAQCEDPEMIKTWFG
jgi:hypothetical protein